MLYDINEIIKTKEGGMKMFLQLDFGFNKNQRDYGLQPNNVTGHEITSAYFLL